MKPEQTQTNGPARPGRPAPTTSTPDRPVSPNQPTGSMVEPQGDRPRQRRQTVAASYILARESNRLTVTIVVAHNACGRHHVHHVRDVDTTTFVDRRGHCGRGSYRIVLGATPRVPKPRRPLDDAAVTQ